MIFSVENNVGVVVVVKKVFVRKVTKKTAEKKLIKYVCPHKNFVQV